MAGKSYDLRATPARTRAHTEHEAAEYYNSIQRLLNINVVIDSSNPAREIIDIIRALKNKSEIYNQASRALTRLYSESRLTCSMQQERVKRRDCMSDVSEAIINYNQMLIELGHHGQSALEYSTSSSIFDVSTALGAASLAPAVASPAPIHPRTSTPTHIDEAPELTPVLHRHGGPVLSESPTAAFRQQAPVDIPASAADVRPATRPPPPADETPAPAPPMLRWEESGPSGLQSVPRYQEPVFEPFSTANKYVCSQSLTQNRVTEPFSVTSAALNRVFLARLCYLCSSHGDLSFTAMYCTFYKLCCNIHIISSCCVSSINCTWAINFHNSAT